MQNSRNRTHQVDATNAGIGLVAEGGMLSEGEGMGISGRNTGILNERPNKSLNRNSGPEGRPSANPATMPMAGRGARRTGRI